MSAHPTSRETHAAHADERNRLNQLARSEHASRAGATLRAIGPLVQPHEPHAFQPPDVTPVSPRRTWAWPAAPGGPDNTGFSNGVC